MPNDAYMSHDSPDDDLLWEAQAIGKFIQRSQRETYYLLERRLIPAFKLGGRWGARKSTLRAHFAKLEAGTECPS